MVENRVKLINSELLDYVLNVDFLSLSRCEQVSLVYTLRAVLSAFVDQCAVLEERLTEVERKVDVPEYIPQQTKVDDWIKDRDLSRRERESEIENKRLMVQSEAAAKLGQSLSGNSYAPYAVEAFVKGAISTTAQPAEDPYYNARLAQATKKGFVWPTRGGKKPARQSTCEKYLKEWELQYAEAEALSDEDMLDARKVSAVGAGGISCAINRLRPLTKGHEFESGLNSFNLYQKMVKAVSDSGKPVVSAKTAEGYPAAAEALCDRVFGSTLAAADRAEVVRVYTDRIAKVGGIEHLTVDLAKRCCNLRRLPIFFPWNPAHSTPDSKLFSLKGTEYDHYYEKLLEEFRVES